MKKLVLINLMCFYVISLFAASGFTRASWQRQEPHLLESKENLFSVKFNDHGVLKNIPSLTEFRAQVLASESQKRSFKILCQVLLELKENDWSCFTRETPGAPLFTWKQETGKLELYKNFARTATSEAYKELLSSCDELESFDRDEENKDIYDSAMLIFYVKSFVHPRWLIKSADETPKASHNQKTINLEINTWNSFRDDLGFMTSSFVAIKKLTSFCHS